MHDQDIQDHDVQDQDGLLLCCLEPQSYTSSPSTHTWIEDAVRWRRTVSTNLRTMKKERAVFVAEQGVGEAHPTIGEAEGVALLV